MRRVVITGLGIVSSIGNNKKQVLASLKEGKSGIVFESSFKEKGLRSNVSGRIKNLNTATFIDKKSLRFMGNLSYYAAISMKQAIEDSNLPQDLISNERVGLIVGSGGASAPWFVHVIDAVREKSSRRLGPFLVPKLMSSSCSATLATAFKIKGYNYSIASACATSTHCIGNAYELIKWNKQDIIFSGGAEELSWVTAASFDAMGALSSKFNDTPQRASRPYDEDRDGFVLGEGGAIIVLEELEHARARGAKIYAEIVGYGANSDGHSMVAPSGEGAVRCMKMALGSSLEYKKEARIQYINTHGTSTPVGDLCELKAIQTVFGDRIPIISSTKSYTGHSLGATGAQEIIYSLLMMENNFVAKSLNIDTLDPQAEAFPIAVRRIDNIKLNTVLSNSFGFGGTNACILLEKYQ